MSRTVLCLLTTAVVASGCNRAERPPKETAPESANPSSPPQRQTSEALLARLDGARFVSQERYETGLGADGKEVLGHWYVTFRDGTATWDWSDAQSSGSFTITADGEITFFGTPDLTGSFNPETGELVWDGLPYKLEEDGAD